MAKTYNLQKHSSSKIHAREFCSNTIWWGTKHKQSGAACYPSFVLYLWFWQSTLSLWFEYDQHFQMQNKNCERNLSTRPWTCSFCWAVTFNTQWSRAHGKCYSFKAAKNVIFKKRYCPNILSETHNIQLRKVLKCKCNFERSFLTDGKQEKKTGSSSFTSLYYRWKRHF